MRTVPTLFHAHRSKNYGVTLIELLVFIVVVSVALVTLLGVLASQVSNSVDPVARVRALEKGQALLDEIVSRKFDEATPTGGTPACGTGGASPCVGMVTDGDFDDVADYAGYSDGADPYTATVTVVEAGSDLGLANEYARLITVTVQIPGGESMNLSAYRTNF